jgi:hypothetical protein
LPKHAPACPIGRPLAPKHFCFTKMLFLRPLHPDPYIPALCDAFIGATPGCRIAKTRSRVPSRASLALPLSEPKNPLTRGSCYRIAKTRSRVPTRASFALPLSEPKNPLTRGRRCRITKTRSRVPTRASFALPLSGPRSVTVLPKYTPTCRFGRPHSVPLRQTNP